MNDRVPWRERPLAWRCAVVGGATAAVLLGLSGLWTLAQAGDRPLALGSASWLWTAALAAGALAVMTSAGQRLGLWGLRIFFVLAGLPMLLRGLRDGELWLLVGAGLCTAWLFATAFARPTHARD